jgi:TonB family protein
VRGPRTDSGGKWSNKLFATVKCNLAQNAEFISLHANQSGKHTRASQALTVTLIKTMMRFLIFLIASTILVLNGVAQKSDTTFYKDKWTAKETSKKKAKFYKILEMDNSIKTSRTYQMSDNTLIYQQAYKDDMPTDLWIDKRFSGRVDTMDYRFVLIYSDKRVENGIYPDLENYENVDNASYEKGIQGFYQHLAKTLRYPAHARRYGIEGKVYVHFKVSKTGNIEFVSIFKGVNKYLDQEAARVFVQAPDWVPATQNQEKIDSYYILPITFKLG